ARLEERVEAQRRDAARIGGRVLGVERAVRLLLDLQLAHAAIDRRVHALGEPGLRAGARTDLPEREREHGEHREPAQIARVHAFVPRMERRGIYTWLPRERAVPTFRTDASHVGTRADVSIMESTHGAHGSAQVPEAGRSRDARERPR